MKKTLLSLAILICAVLTVKAQDDDLLPRFSAGFGVGVTTGPQHSGFPAAGSVGLKGEYPIAGSPVCITASVAYQFYVSSDGYNYSYNSNYGESTTGTIASFVPVMAGARVYVNKLFFEGDVGASFNLNSGKSYTAQKVAPILSPSIGYGFRFGSSQKIGLDLSLSYETRLEKTQTPSDPSTVSPYISGYGAYNLVAFHVAFSLGL
ncbi:hypothetical protein [Mucilaginibacter ginsenosidivorax]|uniref:Outer membrane protein beta-barrel domain-containing protein n=1 Tax=Mucilaginibacter ginsenosidivorax TaxID=862126 RepID=A0A5B8VVM7_9SPHI|nr:hypothetical protein [Mucilaginibacter ginsenosidivorax]QEC75637.1 hypothetical protein FSB76_06625 [Mucilaginibacter ginsenosidivorax]